MWMMEEGRTELNPAENEICTEEVNLDLQNTGGDSW